MAYSESTSVADRNAFIAALVNFAVANAGFTNQGTSVDSSYTIYHISKGSIYWNFVAEVEEATICISCRMSFAKITTYAAFTSTATAAQYQSTMMATYHSGPYIKYFLYSDGDAVHCTLQLYEDVWTHISFGNIIKFGSWTGGEYVTAQGSYKKIGEVFYSWDSVNVYAGLLFDGGANANFSTIIRVAGYVRHLIGAPSGDANEFARLGNVIRNNQRCQMVSAKGVFEILVETCGPIGFNLRAPLFPVYVFLLDTVTGRSWFAGYVSGARVLNIQNISSATIVENDWISFPMVQREGGDNTLSPLSQYWGVAYKRVA